MTRILFERECSCCGGRGGRPAGLVDTDGERYSYLCEACRSSILAEIRAADADGWKHAFLTKAEHAERSGRSAVLREILGDDTDGAEALWGDL